MRKTIQLLLFTLLLTSVTCDHQKAKSSSSSETSTATTEVNCKTLLIIAEDRSGSTTDHRKLSKDDYTRLINAFQNHNSGQIAVRVIGNPAPSEREFFILRIQPLKPYLAMYKKDPLLSEKTALRVKNKKIEEENKKIKKHNKIIADDFIKKHIVSKVLAYKPYKGKDLTDIAGALKHIQTKTNEPTFKSYDQIQVLIISDGKHDATRLKQKLHFDANDNVQLFLIGWQDSSVFDTVENKNSFESVDGFIAYYQDLKCTK